MDFSVTLNLNIDLSSFTSKITTHQIVTSSQQLWETHLFFLVFFALAIWWTVYLMAIIRYESDIDFYLAFLCRWARFFRGVGSCTLTRRMPWCRGWICLLGKSEITGSNPTLVFKFQRNKIFLPHSLVKIQYCGEPLWPRGSVHCLRPPGLEFRILCLEGSVFSFISLSSGGSPSPV